VDADIIEDSEDLGGTLFSYGDEDDSVIPAKPLDSRPLFGLGRRFF
jgi:hypothetical protein